MADFGAIRTALATRLQTIDGLRVFDTTPDQIPAGAGVAIVMPPDGGPVVEFNVVARNVHRWRLVVEVFTGRVVNRTGQNRLDAYLSTGAAGSIYDAIVADITLGGVAAKTIVVMATNYRIVVFADGQEYYAVDFHLEITA